ncbi:hypothetical protein QTO34_016272 [Cnephaeus nilssonii]|uniref:Histone deacetylase complex subunit SAP30L n=1 Tax=Cnephaeus nilssonii TaxID=3371016 RepID=A0AA40I5M0_CNENI|nr:hypothetical protein QTO34_016272 [Eptesicus nilssonii]
MNGFSTEEDSREGPPARPRRRPGLRPELLPHRGRRALRPAGGQRLLQQEGPEEHLAKETQAGHRQERESPGPGRVPAPERSRLLPPNSGRDSGALPAKGEVAVTSLSAAASASAKGHGAAASQAAVGKRGRNKAKTRASEVAFAVEVRHLYICDFHKNFIQSVRNKRKRKTSDDGGDSPEHDTDIPEVDLFQLQVNTLRRYKRHYKLQTRPGFNKAQLAETVSRHFRNIPVNEKETLAYFIYMVKSNKSRLDQKSEGGKQLDSALQEPGLSGEFIPGLRVGGNRPPAENPGVCEEGSSDKGVRGVRGDALKNNKNSTASATARLR